MCEFFEMPSKYLKIWKIKVRFDSIEQSINYSSLKKVVCEGLQ